MKIRRSLLATLCAAFAVPVMVLIAMTWFGPAAQPFSPPGAPPVLDGDAAARLAQAVKLQTVSVPDDPQANATQFRALRDHIESSFPRVHAHLKREVVGQSLLYVWPGRDASAPPVLWLAHQDVVPASPQTRAQWTHDPFGGEVRDGLIWGRGSWDDKGNLFAQLEAIEGLLAQGYTPRRTLVLAYGEDEETGGARGAANLAELLRARGLHFEYVIDEGLVVADGLLKDIHRPIALIGVAEKGYATFVLHADGQSGHSSMPPPQTSLDVLSRAVASVNDAPMPARLDGVARQMLVALSGDMPFLQRAVMDNLWLFGGLVGRQMAKTPFGNAMVRTTLATTVIRGGDADNVLPGPAEARINARLRPGDSAQQVLQYVREAVRGAGVRVDLDTSRGSEASPVSRSDSRSYRLVERSVRDVFPDAAVAPATVMGGTDSRYFVGIADDVYRFSPVRVTAQDTERFHGIDERISTANYAQMIRFYERLLRNDDDPR